MISTHATYDTLYAMRKKKEMLQRNNHRKKKAQVTIEFAFCMVAILALIYGLAMVLKWIGVSFVERNRAYEQTIGYVRDEDIGVTADFYRPSKTDDFEFVMPTP